MANYLMCWTEQPLIISLNISNLLVGPLLLYSPTVMNQCKVRDDSKGKNKAKISKAQNNEDISDKTPNSSLYMYHT